MERENTFWWHYFFHDFVSAQERNSCTSFPKREKKKCWKLHWKYHFIFSLGSMLLTKNKTQISFFFFFAYFTIWTVFYALSLWPFRTCEYIKNHKWSSFTSHIYFRFCCNQLNQFGVIRQTVNEGKKIFFPGKLFDKTQWKRFELISMQIHNFYRHNLPEFCMKLC